MDKAVVLHSGGQDSTTCLLWAIDMWGTDKILTVNFDYGQRHSIERECADRISDTLGVPRPYSIPVEALKQLGGAALTNDDIDVQSDATGSGNTWAEEHELPSTFVPGRNLVFLSLAAAYAAQNGAKALVTGVCEADAAGYPDCRGDFVRATEQAISLALDDTFYVHAPLLELNKAQTFVMADMLGALDLVRFGTHTCYEGVHDEGNRHPWGYGCGECPACKERKAGWEGYEFLKAEAQA